VALPAADAFSAGSALPGLRHGALASATARSSAPARSAAASSLIAMSASEDSSSSLSRRDAFTSTAGAALAAWLAGAPQPSFAALEMGPKAGETGELEGGLKYKVETQGKGPKPKVGDLVAIRFSASYKGKEFDNCFKTPNSYYFRVGVESVIKGLDVAVLNMRVGDKWALTIPGNLAFGEKGVKASAGKPKIPGNATIDYVVFLETFPGAEDEILEVTDGEAK